MKKLIFALIFTLQIGLLVAQIPEKEEEETPEMIDEHIPLEKEELEYLKLLKNKKAATTTIPYEKQKIKDEIYWIYDNQSPRKNRTFGILIDDEIVLPPIFSLFNGKSTYSESNTKILSLRGYKGVYNLDTQTWDIPLIYNSLEELEGGLYIALKEDKKGIIDLNNNIITNFQWIDIEPIKRTKGYVYVTQKNAGQLLKGIYNTDQKELIVPCKYNTIFTYNKEGIFKVSNGNGSNGNGKLCNIINLQNELLFKNWYHSISMSHKDSPFCISPLISQTEITDKNSNFGYEKTYME